MLCYVENILERQLPYEGRLRGRLSLDACFTFVIPLSHPDRPLLGGGSDDDRATDDMPLSFVEDVQLKLSWSNVVCAAGAAVRDLDANNTGTVWTMAARFTDSDGSGPCTRLIRALGLAWSESAVTSTVTIDDNPLKFLVNKAIKPLSQFEAPRTPERLAQTIDNTLQQLFLPEEMESPTAEEMATMRSLRLPGCPPRSLLAALVTRMVHQYHLQGMVRLWREFVSELRWFWEEGILLPRVGTDCPDHTCCLIYQKLQMLNCCIAQRSKQQHSTLPPIDDFSPGRPAGRAGEVQGVYMTNKMRLYEPCTLDACPLTSDLTQERMVVLSNLHLEPQESQLRTLVEHRVLKSDMQAFKAANPGCVLHDFSNWRALRPRADKAAASLQDAPAPSEAAADTWQRIWEEAEPLPAVLQQPLFDFQNMAERVLHYLEHLSNPDIWSQLFCCGVANAIHTLSESPAAEAAPLQDALGKLKQDVESLAEIEETLTRQQLLETICEDSAKVELLLARANALQHHIEDRALVGALCSEDHVEIALEQRPSVGALFCSAPQGGAADLNRLAPTARQFIATLPTGDGNRKHRAFVRLTDVGFRIASKVHGGTR